VADVTARVNDWATAWRQKDADSYLKFYADKFTPEPPLDNASWTKQRRERLSTSGKVDFKVDDIQVTCDGDKANVKFKQNYSVTTDEIKATGKKRTPVTSSSNKLNKELQFEFINGQWKIVRDQTNK